MSHNSLNTAFRRMGFMLLAACGFWLLFAGPAYWSRGTLALEGLTYASLLCLVPGWVVVYVTARYPDSGSQATAVIMGTGLRMAFVLVGMVTLRGLRPEFGHYEFQLWLILFYMAFLFLETLMLVKQSNNTVE
ncbi:MAG: hypothetical protein P8M30_03830 [Planctomycetaceae bacterium]|nr:hypothetical protein [Planctomycetaceae bacterium]MDG2388433.1 hypothetical protein [Planctomycetaceae bacterium]